MGVVANVAINLDARRPRQELDAFTNAAKRTGRQLESVVNASRRTETALGGITTAVRRLALAYGTLRTAQAALEAGVSRIESERRIQFLARGYGEAAELASAATRATERFGVSQTEANIALATTYARLRPVGIELEKIESVYAGFNTAARLSGATAVEASQAFRQLAQALGSGALRGDEFRSVSEQVPLILTAVSKETGIAQGQLRDYAAEGKLTADIVIRALQRIEKEGADQLEEALNGPQQKIKDFKNAFENVQVALTQDVIPVLTTNLEELSQLITNLEGPIRFIGQVAAQTIGTINDLINLATKPGQAAARKSIEGGRLPAFPLKGATEDLFKNVITPFGTGLGGVEAEARQQAAATGKSYAEAFVDAMQKYLQASDAAKKLDAAFQRGEGGLRKPDPAFSPPVDPNVAKEAKKLADELARSFKTGNQLFTQFSRQAVLIGETSEIERKRLQIQYDYQDRAEQIAELKNTEQQINLSQVNDEIRRLELLELQTEELEKQIKKAQKLTDEIIKRTKFGVAGEGTVAGGIGKEIDRLKDELKPVELATKTIVSGATAIGDAFSTAFGEVITGSKSVQEALGDAFKKIGEAFISMALEIIAKQMTLIILQTIFNALSGASGFQADLSNAGKNLSGKGALSPGKMFPSGVFAEGGFVTGPTNALIGEGGEPEYVIPASKMRGAMNRYAAGARGSSVIPSGGEQGTGEGGTAVATPIDVRYTVERINTVDYVTADQFQAGMQQAAQQGAAQGEQRTLRRLQMSTSTRKRLGM